MNVTTGAIKIINILWNDMWLLHVIVIKIYSIHYSFSFLSISVCKSSLHCVYVTVAFLKQD